MKAHFSLTRRDLNVLIACLLSFSILMMPFVPIAAASGRSERQSRGSRDQSSQAGQAVAANASLPAPAPLVATVTANKSGAILNDDGDMKADPTNGNPGTTEKIEYTVTISNTGNTDATNVVFTDTIDAHTTLVDGSITTQPIAVNDTYSSIGNVGITVSDGASDLLANDCDPDPLGGPCTNTGLTISVLGGDNSAPFDGTSANGGQVTATTGDGSFQYNPAPGFEGSDSFTYTVVDGTGKTDTATVNITVTGMIWFVNASAPAGGDGRLLSPFNCLVGAGSCFSGATADQAGDFIFLYSGTYNDTAALVLLADQKLIGAAATAPLAGPVSITNLTIPAHSNALPATGGASPLITSTASGIQLASGNLLRGFTVGDTATTVGNYDILNTNMASVGNLTILEVVLNGNGGLFRADSGGNLSVSFPSASTGSAGSNGIHLGLVSGSVAIGGSGLITGVALSDVLINGGTVSMTCASSITHGVGTSPMVSIGGGHMTGTVTFTGTLNASSGTGLLFDNADSTTSYNFNGSTTLAGGDAGIDIQNGSAGTFNFGGTTITNPSGIALNVSASSGAISISGAISKNNDGKLIDFDNYDTGTATISGTLSCTSTCDGIEVTNNGAGAGTVNFSGATKTLNTGASPAVNLNDNDGGSVNFTGGGLDIDTTSGAGFVATNGGTVTVTTGTNANAIDTTTGTSLNVTGTTIGAAGLTFRNIAANGPVNAIILNNTGTSGGLTVTGTGSTANSGGLIQNCSGDCISIDNSGGHSFNLMRLNNLPGGGFFIRNLTGTNTIARSTIENFNTSNQTALDLINTSANNATLTLDGTLFQHQNNNNGMSAVVVALHGGVTFTFNVQDSDTGDAFESKFTDLFGSGIVVGPGENLSAYNANLIFNVSNTKFQDAFLLTGTPDCTDGNPATACPGGINDLEMTVQGNSTINFNITNNTFSNVTRGNASAIVGVINFNALNNGRISGTPSNISNNTITNIGTSSAVAEAGYIGIRIAPDNTSAVNHNLNIQNNTITDIIRQGILVSARNQAVMDLKIEGNTVGTSALPVGQSNRRGIELETQAAAVMNVQVINNPSIWNSGTSNSNSALHLRSGAASPATGTLNATVTGNTIGNTTGGNNGRFKAETLLDSANMCLDLANNTLQAAANQFDLTDGSTGTFNFRNGGGNTGTVVTTGTITNIAVACPQPNLATSQALPQKDTNQNLALNKTSLPVLMGGTSLGSFQPSVWTRAVSAIAGFAREVHSLIEPAAHASADNSPSTSAPAYSSSAIAPTRTMKGASNARDKSQAKSSAATSRKAVTSHHARTSRSLEPTPMVAGETVTINIGTLRPGDSVTITFQVTVNNPPDLDGVPPGAAQVSNFGTVDFMDGATPGSVNTNTVDTPVDRFDSETTVISDLEPANQGDTINFTATVVIHPSQTPTPPSPVTPTGTVTFKSDGVDIDGCVNVALDGSAQAVCTTNALTPPSHMITAVYSGDGNYDPSTSAAITQTVIACLTNPTVTSTADDGTAGTLRHTIANVCNNNTITFDLPGDGPHTITLTTGEIPVAKNVIIKNISGESITVSGGGASRVFNINPSQTVAIIGLTISGGDSATSGGGILNDGTLTIVNSTLSGNSTDIDGGAISNSGPGVLTLINTTISGNSAAGNGGGVVNLGGTLTSINSTITNNFADSDANSIGTGGGIHHGSGTTTLKNTIVAGNFNEDGMPDAADDISGNIDTTAAASFNLIGTGGAGGLTNGVNNNQVGVADAGLGALADNGGTTFTHALAPTSAAVEAGGNANLPADTFDVDGNMNVMETLPVDQRGTGFPRNADSQDADAVQTVDIGAFELHPSVEDITDKSVAEDNLLSFSFNLGDGTGSLIASVTATSDNATLIPNANILVSGSGTTRTLDITPAANANSPSDGTATITVTVTATNGRTAVDTFVVTVTEVNDNPVAVDDVLTAIDEDSGTRIIPFGDLTSNDSPGPANESGQTLTVTNVSNPVGGTVVINGMNVEFTPTANFFGAASFDYTVTDNGTTDGVSDAKSDTGSVSFTINAINDPPSFTIAAEPPASNEDGGPQTVLNFATDISAGPNETGQILTFNISPVSSTGTLTFSSGPAIDATTGTLTYTATGDTNGTATFSVTLSDDGSNVSPNSNTSAAQQFTITVNAQNDNPVVTTTAGNLSFTEGDAATPIDPFLTVTDLDSPTLVSATVAITSGFVSAEDTLAFTDQLGIIGNYDDTTGVLTLTGPASVEDFQTALRSVTYHNGSDNPTSSRTVTFTANDGVGTGSASRGITISAVNDAPVNTVPGPQSTNQNTPLTFTGGNAISVADADAGSADIQVTLTATDGTITLGSIPAGLSFTVGDGTADPTMTFQGTLSEVNTAMNGMTFTPDMGFSGAATLTINTNDLGNTGSGGPMFDEDVVDIQVATNVSIQDAQVAEPKSGSVNMIFTVTLSAPAPASGSSVNFTTVQLAPALNHATAGQDYTTTSGTVSFLAGEQFKTILVPVLSDNKKNEGNESFEVHLSIPMNLTILGDGIATGTIIENEPAGEVLISELRTSGPDGGEDEFVEIYNNKDSAIMVNGTGGGYGLFKMGASCSATPVLIGVIPNGTMIPARGHFLFTGSAYSLADYGGTGAAAGDVMLSSDIENDRNVALFKTASLAEISSANRLDAVGFGPNVGGTCDLFREGNTLTPVSGSTLDYTYFRDECGKKGNPSTFGPCPTGGLTKDSNVNADDFIYANTTVTSTVAGHRLGAPGPQNLESPHFTFDVLALLLDSSKNASGNPNRVRDTTAIGPNAAEGTMSIRRRFQNNTGADVTRLRIRVVDISTAFVSGGVADLRLLSSSDVTVTVNDSATCTAAGASTPCNITVLGTTLETPPNQPAGGGFNSSATVLLATPLAPGASVNLQFLLGVQSTGSFKFFFNVEALP